MKQKLLLSLATALPLAADANSNTWLFVDNGGGNQMVNNGTINGGVQTFGSVRNGTLAVDEGAWLTGQGAGPEWTLNQNQGYFFDTILNEQKVGGGVNVGLQFAADNKPKNVAVKVTYASGVKEGLAPGPLWSANFHWLDTGEDPGRAGKRWKDLVEGAQAGKYYIKEKIYDRNIEIGNPPPEADQPPGAPANPADPREVWVFFTAAQGLDYLDFYLGDMGLTQTAWAEGWHFIPSYQILCGSPTDFGFDPGTHVVDIGALQADANGKFGLAAAFSVADIPEPASGLLLLLGGAGLLATRRLRLARPE